MENPLKDKSCSVCFSDFEKGRKAVMCPFCSEKDDIYTCKECTEDYLLGSLEEAHCMSCKTKWGHALMYNSFSSSFITGKYRKHRQKVALDREKSLLPSTMPLVDEEKRKIGIQKNIDVLNAKRVRYLARMRELKKKVNDINNEIKVHKVNMANGGTGDKKKIYISPCPEDGCRGYIEKDGHKCGLCDVRICRRCHYIFESRDEKKLKKEKKDHECDEDEKASVKEKLKGTKPCPKCKTRIFYIEGCDQMWCTQCRTPFSWNTGEIVTGTIHNPHYYEMMRNAGHNRRNIGDVPCGGLPDYFVICGIYETTGQIIELNPRGYTKFPLGNLGVCMDIIHRRAAELQDYIDKERRLQQVKGDTMEQIRLDYLVDRIKEDKEFKSSIFRAERTKEKKDEELQLLDTFVTGVREVLIEFVREGGELVEKRLNKTKIVNLVQKLVDDVVKMANFTNKAFKENYTAMNYKVFPQIVLTRVTGHIKSSNVIIKVGEERTYV